MDFRPRLLEHPFYQAWTKGELSVEQLARYHQGYARFIERFPFLWRTVIDTFLPGCRRRRGGQGRAGPHRTLETLGLRPFLRPVTHPAWKRPSPPSTPCRLPACSGPSTHSNSSSPRSLPPKRTGCCCHYGFRPDQLTYFDGTSTKRSTSPTDLGLQNGSWIPRSFPKGSGAERRSCTSRLTNSSGSHRDGPGRAPMVQVWRGLS